MGPIRIWVGLVLSLPIVVAIATVVTVALMETTGSGPWSAARPRNSAEAAAMGRAADLVRFLRRGDDATRLYGIRAEIIAPTVRLATTYEAAVWSRRVEMLRLLDREGGTLDATVRRDLACLSLDLDQPDLASYLVPDLPPTCEPGRTLALITARTTGQLR